MSVDETFPPALRLLVLLRSCRQSRITNTHFIFYVSNLSFFRSLSLPLLCSFFHILSLPSNKNRRQDNRRFLFSLRFFFSLARANDLLRIVAILNPANVAISLKSLCTSRAMPKDDNPSNDSYFYSLLNYSTGSRLRSLPLVRVLDETVIRRDTRRLLRGIRCRIL